MGLGRPVFDLISCSTRAIRNGCAITLYGAIRAVDVPSERTFVTELATALGMCKGAELEEIIEDGQRRCLICHRATGRSLPTESSGRFETDFQSGFQNGRHFSSPRTR